jgi:FkbM family methyltransferase
VAVAADRNATLMLSAIRDLIIVSGIDRRVRPIWRRLRGKTPDLYDEQTRVIIRTKLPRDAVCVDVGCNKGIILDLLIRHRPDGRFFAFEPNPRLADVLRRKYRRNPRVTVFEVAAYSEPGETTFYVDRDSAGLSGLRDRSTPGAPRNTVPVRVRADRLDNVIPDISPHFIKIDVEGAELHVLEGARAMLARSRPIVVFEFGLGGADFYGTGPDMVFDLFAGHGMRVSLMGDFLADRPPLGRDEFRRQYAEHINYYFVAHP